MLFGAIMFCHTSHGVFQAVFDEYLTSEKKVTRLRISGHGSGSVVMHQKYPTFSFLV